MNRTRIAFHEVAHVGMPFLCLHGPLSLHVRGRAGFGSGLVHHPGYSYRSTSAGRKRTAAHETSAAVASAMAVTRRMSPRVVGAGMARAVLNTVLARTVVATAT